MGLAVSQCMRDTSWECLRREFSQAAWRAEECMCTGKRFVELFLRASLASKERSNAFKHLHSPLTSQAVCMLGIVGSALVRFNQSWQAL